MARRLRLVSDEPLEVNLDGEIAATTPATFEVDRNALHIVVPAHSRAARMDDVPVSSAPPHTPASRPD